MKANKPDEYRSLPPLAVNPAVEFEVRFGGAEAIGVLTSNHLSTRERDSSREKIPFRRKQHSENLLAVRKVRAR